MNELPKPVALTASLDQQPGLFKHLEALFDRQDTLRTVPQIALFHAGAATRKTIRATYHVLESSYAIPAAKPGGVWEARKSAIRAKRWMEERRSFAEPTQERLVRIHLLLSALLRLLPSQSAAISQLSYDEAQFLGVLLEAKATIEQLLSDVA
jgi:hypothetical protein